MSDEPNAEAARQRLTRCLEGHVFDAAAHSNCPICSARPAHRDNADGQPAPPKRNDPAPQPVWLGRTVIAGGAVVIVLMIIVGLRGVFQSETGKPAKVVAENTRPPIAARKDTAPVAPDAKEPVAEPQKYTGALPRTVERWRTVMVIGGRSYDCVNETTPDGRYRLGDGCPPPFNGETGVTVVNADGSWTSRSDAGRTDAGTIQFIDADHFIAHTRGGPVVWERVD